MYLGNCPNSRPEIASMRKTLVRGGSAKKNQACWYSIRRAGFMTLGVGLSHFPVHITTVMEGVLDPPLPRPDLVRRGGGSEYIVLGEAGERGFSTLCIGTETRVASHGAWRRGVGGLKGGRGGARGSFGWRPVAYRLGYSLQLPLVFRPRGV